MPDSAFEQFFGDEEHTRGQLLARLGLGGAAIALPGVLAASGTALGATTSRGCYATGESCSLGIDPDVYRMPLTGEFMQHGSRRICVTKNWSAFPPEIFDVDFLRGFWPSLPDAAQQATEAAAFGFVTTHWGPPDAPPGELVEVATPAAFPDEVFSSLSSRSREPSSSTRRGLRLGIVATTSGESSRSRDFRVRSSTRRRRTSSPWTRSRRRSGTTAAF